MEHNNPRRIPPDDGPRRTGGNRSDDALTRCPKQETHDKERMHAAYPVA